jgi:hypothetical protein
LRRYIEEMSEEFMISGNKITKIWCSDNGCQSSDKGCHNLVVTYYIYMSMTIQRQKDKRRQRQKDSASGGTVTRSVPTTHLALISCPLF